jgi:hypothetical protein
MHLDMGTEFLRGLVAEVGEFLADAVAHATGNRGRVSDASIAPIRSRREPRWGASCAGRRSDESEERSFAAVPSPNHSGQALRTRHRRVLRTSRMTTKNEGKGHVNGAHLKVAATNSRAKATAKAPTSGSSTSD